MKTVGGSCQPQNMETSPTLLTWPATAHWCPDCGERALFLPVDDGTEARYCCLSCDAAVTFSMAVSA